MSRFRLRALSAAVLAALVLGFAGTSSANADDRHCGGRSQWGRSYSGHRGGHQGYRSHRGYSRRDCDSPRYGRQFHSPRNWRGNWGYSSGFNRGNRYNRRGCD